VKAGGGHFEISVIKKLCHVVQMTTFFCQGANIVDLSFCTHPAACEHEKDDVVTGKVQ